MQRLEDILKCLEKPIRDAFDHAVGDAGLRTDPPSLVLSVGASKFEAAVQLNFVRITWCGIASLWSTSLAAAIISRRAFAGRREVNGTAAPRLDVNADPLLTLALHLFDFSVWVSTHPNGSWPQDYPHPCEERTDDDFMTARSYFMSALEWIMRHELAHIQRQHSYLGSPAIMRREETEADDSASLWLKGSLAADMNRPAGENPGLDEIKLELRATAAGMALLWVALFEKPQKETEALYPAIADRLERSFRLFELAEDSFAAEVLGDSFKAWLDPEGAWPQETDPKLATSIASLMQSLEYLKNKFVD